MDYLELEDVLALLPDTVGHDFKIRDVGLIESALARPSATAYGEDAYPTLSEKAAALLHSFATNHPLIDGNKRLSWVACRLFIGLNGHDIVMTQDDKFELVMAIASGELRDVAAIARIIEAHLTPSTS